MIGTLEDLRLKEKWNAAYIQFCQQHECSDECIVKQEAIKLKASCLLVFCRMKEAGKI